MWYNFKQFLLYLSKPAILWWNKLKNIDALLVNNILIKSKIDMLRFIIKRVGSKGLKLSLTEAK